MLAWEDVTMRGKLVQLRVAKIPFIGFMAVHCWFAIRKEEKFERWEVWQRANLKQPSWGHLHKNLMPYNYGVGNGDSWIEYQWFDKEADLLIEIIEKTPQMYPYNYKYRYYPGPNSNTYIQWILNQSNFNYSLSKKAIGKNFPLIFS